MEERSTAYKIATYLFVFLALTTFSARAQINCEIVVNDDIVADEYTACYGEEIKLSVEFNPDYIYTWTCDGVICDTTNSHIINPIITKNNTIFAINVSNPQTSEQCDDYITIKMHPRFNINFDQIKLTCSDNSADNGKTAKVRAFVDGDTVKPYRYTYQWSTPYHETDDPQVAIGLKARMEYTVTVTDNETNCSQSAKFRVKSYPNPKIKISSTPKDTVYLQKPFVVWSFENESDSIEVTNFFWKFREDETSYTEATPTVTYVEEDESKPVKTYLTVTNDCGCDTIFEDEILVLPVKLKIPNIFTPNGDGINDYFIIAYDESGGTTNQRGEEYEQYVTLSEYYISHELTIFNRWGRIVYKSKDYKNDWDGGKLSDGTYFYVLKCVGKYRNDTYKGSVMIWNSGR